MIKQCGLNEIKNNLSKGIEILGGNSSLFEGIDNLVWSSFLYNEGKITINSKDYTAESILSQKIQYEKYLLKNKKIYVEKITYKINKYNKDLVSLAKKYKKDNSIETYNEIISKIYDNFKFDIDNYVLGFVEGNKEESDLYGDYLVEKREFFVKEILFKIIPR